MEKFSGIFSHRTEFYTEELALAADKKQETMINDT